MKTEDKYDCDKNPANIPDLFRDSEHLEEVVQLALQDPRIDKSREAEIRLAAQCNDFGLLSNSLDDAIHGYSNALIIEKLVDYANNNKK